MKTVSILSGVLTIAVAATISCAPAKGIEAPASTPHSGDSTPTTSQNSPEVAKVKSLKLPKDCEEMQIKLAEDYTLAYSYYEKAREGAFKGPRGTGVRYEAIKRIIGDEQSAYLGRSLANSCKSPREIGDHLRKMNAMKSDILMYDR